jgi:hypothetical protein
MRIDHPADWELSIASGLDEPGRCLFVDRMYQRLDVRWKDVAQVPNLDLLLERRQRKDGEKLEVAPLAGAPEEWRGLVQKTKAGCVTRAGRFFRNVRRLVEATIVWPQGRDRRTECDILASISPQASQAELSLWQAMGLSLTAPAEFVLARSQARVGRVTWEFHGGGKDEATLEVERLAMPDSWLKAPLSRWLEQQVPVDAKTMRQDRVDRSGHRAESVVSSQNAGLLAGLRGVRRLRLDLAWLCPAEERLYHMAFHRVCRDETISFPPGVEVRCCRPVPGIREGRA